MVDANCVCDGYTTANGMSLPLTENATSCGPVMNALNVSLLQTQANGNSQCRATPAAKHRDRERHKTDVTALRRRQGNSSTSAETAQKRCQRLATSGYSEPTLQLLHARHLVFATVVPSLGGLH